MRLKSIWFVACCTIVAFVQNSSAFAQNDDVNALPFFEADGVVFDQKSNSMRSTFSIEVGADQTTQVDVIATGIDDFFDPFLEVLAEDGSVDFFDDDSGEGLSPRVLLRGGPEGRNVKFRVSHAGDGFSESANSAFSIVVRPSEEKVDGNRNIQIGPERLSGRAVYGAPSTFNFFVERGQTIELTVSTVDGAPRVELFRLGRVGINRAVAESNSGNQVVSVRYTAREVGGEQIVAHVRNESQSPFSFEVGLLQPTAQIQALPTKSGLIELPENGTAGSLDGARRTNGVPYVDYAFSSDLLRRIRSAPNGVSIDMNGVDPDFDALLQVGVLTNFGLAVFVSNDDRDFSTTDASLRLDLSNPEITAEELDNLVLRAASIGSPRGGFQIIISE